MSWNASWRQPACNGRVATTCGRLFAGFAHCTAAAGVCAQPHRCIGCNSRRLCSSVGSSNASPSMDAVAE